MSQAKPTIISAPLDATGLRFAIIVSRYNSLVTKELLDGALDALERHGAKPSDQAVVYTPGAFEIPLVAQAIARKGGFHGVLALGCIMRGATTNNELIAAEVTKGLAAVSMEHGLPVGFGVLTPDTLEQALERAGAKMGNKGAEAALAAIEQANVLRLIAGA
ncbi:MAG: 6,7-dimethyl-8-ribityllumazine synthase [Candidatus Sumerlaeia bacterium]|nr:6,7-dimethyl-8-ribityllumazine synthase [Candidatus Sumerlaeia bacterium]